MPTYVHAGLTFEYSDDGPADGPVVIALHGFPVDRTSWSGITAALVAAGYRVLAPDQRGYSPGARPRGRRAYTLDLLAGDVLALADQAGAATVDVVGHDWGAAIAWYLAAVHPDRVRTLSALSVPHTSAFKQALKTRQALRSWYILMFQLPWLPERFVSSGNGDAFRKELLSAGVSAEIAARYGSRLAHPPDLTGPINWYRAIPFRIRDHVPPVTVPTLFVWSDGDPYITRHTAELCGRWVTGPYRFEILTGISHWIPECAPERTAELILEQLGSA